MKVVIFCGGQGARLREETEYKPKPMVEIGGRPILWHIMKTYAFYGFNDFVLCLGYKQNVIRDYFLHYKYMHNDFTMDLSSGEKLAHHSSHNENWKVTLVDTGLSTKKGRRIKKIEPYITEDRFLLTYGDGVADVNIRALVDFHMKAGKAVTFTGVHPVSRFATINLDARGQVATWEEKRKMEEYINGGFFVVEKKVFSYLDGDHEFEEEPMEKLAQEKEVAMYKHEGGWYCMDTYRDWKFLEDLWACGRAPWKKWD